MALKHYLMLMALGTVFCWAAWVLVIRNINPDEAGAIGLISFYASLFLALLGTLSLLGFFVRVWFSKTAAVFRFLGVSFRQAVWFGLLIVIALLLQANRYLTWWNALLLIIFMTLLEFLLLSRKQPTHTQLHDREA
ncbi:MAG: hypothetical protein UY52_C0016G0028 [Parcubacteria group bacterium GW2011_GWC2_49_9]|nr:MAG: hypothetical protein UY34_C0006G0053 [Parcubacteria group bacterium GW2011_GWA2_48_9]KKW15651.1 MAG: hypothetical protein UY52_C0016G0028 [Parcubacteria group bacterium GW2011_GWC2_49_9]